jgi:hypothetical protein
MTTWMDGPSGDFCIRLGCGHQYRLTRDQIKASVLPLKLMCAQLEHQCPLCEIEFTTLTKQLHDEYGRFVTKRLNP